jgi:LacI family transcriptional regulator
MATEHLIKNGYTKIAHVSGPQHLKSFKERFRGYTDALEKHRLVVDKRYVFQGDISIESGKSAVDYFFSLPDCPDAVFAVEDYSALGVIKGLKERKVRMPGEFGVIGFANENFGEHISPSLSSVDQQTVQMGKEAMSLLMDLMEASEKGTGTVVREKMVLQPLMQVRQSSAGKTPLSKALSVNQKLANLL